MEYTQQSIRETVMRQRDFFRSGETLEVAWRIRQLKRLRAALLRNEKN